MSIYGEAWQVCVHYAVLFFSFGFNALLLVRRCSSWDGVLACVLNLLGTAVTTRVFLCLTCFVTGVSRIRLAQEWAECFPCCTLWQ